MNKEQLKIEAQKAYEIEKEKGLIYDLNGSVGFKVRWEAAVKLLTMKWKMFLRTNRRWSIGHLCNDKNECVCGWKYKPDEYINIKILKEKPLIHCTYCENGIVDNSEMRLSDS